MPLSGYLAIFRRWWWTLIVAVWAAALIGWILGSWIDPTYEARSRLLVGPINGDLDTLRASGQLVQTYAEYVTSVPLLSETIDELGLEMTAAQLEGSVRAIPDDVTRFLTIQVQDSDPALAAAIADSLGQGLIDTTSQAPTRPEGEVRFAENAVPPTSPIAPDVTLIVIVAAAAGLVGAVLLVVLIETLADTVRSPQELGRASGAEPLGTVPMVGDIDGVVPASGTRAGDAYRVLAATLALRTADHGGRSIVLTSADPTRIGSLETMSLAAALAALVPRVVVVDTVGDLPVDHGLAALDRVELDRWAVAAGSHADELDAIKDRIARLTSSSDALVLVHAGRAHDPASLIWARSASAVVLVAFKDRTRRSSVAGAMEDLGRIDAHVVGALLLEPGGRTTARRVRTWIEDRGVAATTPAVASAPVGPVIRSGSPAFVPSPAPGAGRPGPASTSSPGGPIPGSGDSAASRASGGVSPGGTVIEVERDGVEVAVAEEPTAEPAPAEAVEAAVAEEPTAEPEETVSEEAEAPAVAEEPEEAVPEEAEEPAEDKVPAAGITRRRRPQGGTARPAGSDDPAG